MTTLVRYTSRSFAGFLAPLSDRVKNAASDLTEFDEIVQAMKDQEYIFHLAALIGIPFSFEHPWEVTQVIFMGTLNILSAARDIRKGRVIRTSTSEVHGSAQYVPIDEKHPLHTQSPYAASKITADKLGESFYHSYELPIATVRPFNTFGPIQSTRAVIPTLITQMLKGN